MKRKHSPWMMVRSAFEYLEKQREEVSGFPTVQCWYDLNDAMDILFDIDEKFGEEENTAVLAAELRCA